MSALLMKSVQRTALTFGIIAISAIASPVKAWGPEYDTGRCTLSTNKERKNFPCIVARSGGAGGYFMDVYDASQGRDNALAIGKYSRNTLVSSTSDAKFVWQDGRQERVRGEKFNHTLNEWTIWLETGEAISFSNFSND